MDGQRVREISAARRTEAQELIRVSKHLSREAAALCLRAEAMHRRANDRTAGRGRREDEGVTR